MYFPFHFQIIEPFLRRWLSVSLEAKGFSQEPAADSVLNRKNPVHVIKFILWDTL